jgi:hypothetical protein
MKKNFVACIYSGNLLLKKVKVIDAESRGAALDKVAKRYSIVMILTPAEARRIGAVGATAMKGSGR